GLRESGFSDDDTSDDTDTELKLKKNSVRRKRSGSAAGSIPKSLDKEEGRYIMTAAHCRNPK
ncbi:hypothetical protein BaRGS_00022162, partial [Batillaria attramentaria]